MIKAFEGGRDIDGERLYVCRSHKYGQIIPGKYSNSIGKCSVTHNRREAQFNRYEILIESGDTKYQWIRLKKPVTILPENILFGGNKFVPHQIKRLSSDHNSPIQIIDNKGELKIHSMDLLLSSNGIWGMRKRRIRRSISGNLEWSPNWRGKTFEGVERIMSFSRKEKLLQLTKAKSTITEILREKTNCTTHHQGASDHMSIEEVNCMQDSQKDNFYIAKCTLRSGNITSEQIGKIWWNELFHEWIASFSFGGHEIYCLDYSVLTLRIM